MFNGCCNNVVMSNQTIEDRYKQIVWTDCWGDFGAKSIFDAIENLEPGDEINYQTWQKLMYANKLLAKHYNWFKDFHGHMNKGIFPVWNPKTEEYDYEHNFRNPETGNMEKVFIEGKDLKDYLTKDNYGKK